MRTPKKKPAAKPSPGRFTSEDWKLKREVPAPGGGYLREYSSSYVDSEQILFFLGFRGPDKKAGTKREDAAREVAKCVPLPPIESAEFDELKRLAKSAGKKPGEFWREEVTTELISLTHDAEEMQKFHKSLSSRFDGPEIKQGRPIDFLLDGPSWRNLWRWLRATAQRHVIETLRLCGDEEIVESMEARAAPRLSEETEADLRLIETIERTGGEAASAAIQRRQEEWTLAEAEKRTGVSVKRIRTADKIIRNKLKK